MVRGCTAIESCKKGGHTVIESCIVSALTHESKCVKRNHTSHWHHELVTNLYISRNKGSMVVRLFWWQVIFCTSYRCGFIWNLEIFI